MQPPSPRRPPCPRQPRSALRTLWARAGVFALGAALLAGCHTGRKSPVEELKAAAGEYHRGIRWAHYQQASAYVHPEQRARFLEEHDATAGELSILDFEIKTLWLNEEGDAAEVVVDYVWNRLPSTALHRTRVHQLWKLVEDHWFVDEERTEELDPMGSGGSAMP